MLSFNSQSFQLFNVFRSLSFSVFYSFFYFFFFVYQSFLSTYKDIIGKLSIHHIMFFAYGSSQRKWKPFFAGCYFSFTHKQKKLWSCPSVSKVCIQKIYICVIGMVKWVPSRSGMSNTMEKWVCSTYQFFFYLLKYFWRSLFFTK